MIEDSLQPSAEILNYHAADSAHFAGLPIDSNRLSDRYLSSSLILYVSAEKQ
jgi:hypothetical protein